MKALVIVTARFGYDGISNVVTNYYINQNHSMIKMDILTINDIPIVLKQFIEQYGDHNYIMSYRNRNPIRYLYSLTKLVKKEQYDVVHVHGNSNTMFIELFAALLGGCKTRIAHSHNTRCDHPIINTMLYPFFKLVYTDGFACGPEAGKWLFKNKKFTIINNGIDLNRFTPNSKCRDYYRKKFNIDDKIVVGHVGRFSNQKNHKRLLSIFSAIKQINPQIALLMWGEGELMEQIKNQANLIGGDIRFMGTSQEVEKCIQSVDLIIFPSIYEGLPLFLIEAQALKIPCLLSNTISSEVKITDCIFFESLNASDNSWAKKALEIVAQFEYRNVIEDTHEAICKAGYDIHVNSQELFELYKHLIQKNI